MQAPPSGEQYGIAHGDSEAVVTQVGATLRRYSVGALDVIDGFGVGARATDGRGQVLAPWPNRLTDGHYEYRGRRCQAPLNEIGRHDAIHGLVRWLDWTLVERDPAAVTLACAVRPQPGYEWHLHLEVTYALDESGLTVTLEAVNADREPAPFGVGFHPYLTLGTTSIDGLDLTVPAAAFVDPDGPADGTSTAWPGPRTTSGSRAGSDRSSWTRRSATSSSAATDVRWLVWATRRTEGPSSCGSTTPFATSWSTPATSWAMRTGGARPLPSSR